jgi:hypothetical protein
VSFINDDRREKFENKMKARVSEKVFHPLFLVIVADFLEERMQYWIRGFPVRHFFALSF